MDKIVIFESNKGEIQVQLEQETVWLSQSQLITLFERDQSVISRHIANVFKEGELEILRCHNFYRLQSEISTRSTLSSMGN